ncbi:hypothetical protein GLOIN_2v249001 [Rhizophagus irregularis DAOM 181602=DAOM 197198]|uniref:Uncharacterized protein n=1 Tax=Rhizophagus irregularis (strain DAOM 181602 / DAOM 197198 / MUCL 43194) TaxID=747089 RepID=A0A2P4PRN7_RHIID|nr:hypothetical protein GLOIN_2v249001 [Rhizophagus irregularis DAOM 181602=DAOM 197198]POG68059.1 hypothetical protein GLOIN_2v249001 [Rhizophagus irregularis DAOM 181602=DAOM 197198]GET61365.1 hypothetical protein GLOIN_2v249001 [Rhizophagus irregularis DAOM 181602=DAOM 197198]|eukprot:XP_025174925.1 hypothetical protein GLOIN_2v249001 [Rhizophagus irregularis DAOM 181602=DAOM 197198]
MIQNFGYYNNNMHFPFYDWRLSFYNHRLEINSFLSSRISKKVDRRKNAFNESVIILFLYLEINLNSYNINAKKFYKRVNDSLFSNQIRSMEGNEIQIR